MRSVCSITASPFYFIIYEHLFELYHNYFMNAMPYQIAFIYNKKEQGIFHPCSFKNLYIIFALFY